MQRALLILLVVASYAMLAGARNWSIGPLLAIAVLTVLAAPRRVLTSPQTTRALDYALIAIAAGVLLQLVPLPAPVVHALSPHAARVKTALQFNAFNASPTWTTLSIEPEQTAMALATLTLGLLSFWTARGMFGAGGSTRAVCRALALIGVVAAFAALLQKATAPRLLLFMVLPESRSAAPFGAFTNRNHFGAWLLMLATPLFGYLIAQTRIHPPRSERFRAVLKEFLASGAVMTAMGAVVTSGVLLLTLSRSAVMGLGTAALIGWRFGRPRMKLERTALPARLGGLGILLLAAMLFLDIDRWAERIEGSLTSDGLLGRTAIWRQTLPIVGDFWLTGSGAGTFSPVMTQYQQTRWWVNSMQRWAHFNNAHSHFLQVAAEGGLLLGAPTLMALGLFAMLAVRALRADKGEMFWVRVGAVAGLGGIAVQSVFEVALTMPANAVLCGVLAGLALHQREPARPAPADPPTAGGPTPERA